MKVRDPHGMAATGRSTFVLLVAMFVATQPLFQQIT